MFIKEKETWKIVDENGEIFKIIRIYGNNQIENLQLKI